MRIGALETEDLLLLGGVLLLPWAFGGVEIWAFRSAALTIVAAATLAWARGGPSALGLDRRSIWLLPAALLGLWAVFQLLPMPPAVVRVMSPEADAIYRDTFPGYPAPGEADPRRAVEQRALEHVPEVQAFELPDREVAPFEPSLGGRWSGWRPLNLMPAAGAERLHWYAALLLAFLLARSRARSPERERHYRNALFVLFLSLAVFGLVDAAAGNGKLYWVRAPLFQARPFGPYVNPTNFAGVMELGVPWIAGATLLMVRRSRGATWSTLRTPLYATAALVGLLACLATASKSAGLLIGGGLAVILVAAARTLPARLLTLSGLGAIGFLAWMILRGQRLGERVQHFVDVTGGSFEEVGRLVAWKSVFPMIGDFAFVGTGFGSFGGVYLRYMPPGESARWAQLHNDWLQFLVEGGLVAAPLLLWLVWGFWSRLLRRSNLVAVDGIDLESLGLVVGLALLTLHATYDFNHQIPANALLFVVVGAIAIGRAEQNEQGEDAAP